MLKNIGRVISYPFRVMIKATNIVIVSAAVIIISGAIIYNLSYGNYTRAVDQNCTIENDKYICNAKVFDSNDLVKIYRGNYETKRLEYVESVPHTRTTGNAGNSIDGIGKG